MKQSRKTAWTVYTTIVLGWAQWKFLKQTPTWRTHCFLFHLQCQSQWSHLWCSSRFRAKCNHHFGKLVWKASVTCCHTANFPISHLGSHWVWIPLQRLCSGRNGASRRNVWCERSRYFCSHISRTLTWTTGPCHHGNKCFCVSQNVGHCKRDTQHKVHHENPGSIWIYTVADTFASGQVTLIGPGLPFIAPGGKVYATCKVAKQMLSWQTSHWTASCRSDDTTWE